MIRQSDDEDLSIGYLDQDDIQEGGEDDLFSNQSEQQNNIDKPDNMMTINVGKTPEPFKRTIKLKTSDHLVNKHNYS